MKKYLLALVAMAGCASAFYFINGPSIQLEPKPSGGPGYFEFIHSIKGDAPFNAVNNWERQMRFSKRSGEVLDSIQEIGPFNIGGRTRAMLLDRSNENRVFVGAITGGMWVSEASGKNWKALNEKELTLNISHLAQNPLNPDEFYYCTGEGAGNSGAAPGAGIFKSTDHGKTFTQLSATANGNFDYAWRIACSPTDSNTVYVALNSGGVYRSKDGGQSFERVVITSRSVYDMELFPDGTVMISIRAQGVYTSATGDDGSWVLQNSGLPSGTSVGRIELAYCETQANIVYAAVSNSGNTGLTGFYRSADQGKTWTTQKNPTTQGGQYPFTWYCLAVHVKRDDPNSIIIGSVNLRYSNDGGSSWNAAANSHADYHVMSEHPSKPDKIYIGNDGGLYEYDWNDLSTYKDLNWGLNITQFYTGAFAPNGLTVMAGSQDNGTNYSINATDTFYKAYGGDGSYTQISQQSPDLAYVSFQNGRLFRVDNFGTKKLTTTDIIADMDNDGDEDIDDGAWFIHPYGINPQDGEMVFFPTKKRLFRSTSGGFLFDPITNEMNVGTGLQPFCVGISNQLNPTVYVGGSNSLFYRIKNAGITKLGNEENMRAFVPKQLNASFMGCITVSPIDPTELFISYVNYTSEPRVWKVIKADSDTPEFVNISGNLPVGMPVNWIDIDPASPDSVFFAGTDRGLFYTTDGGQTWFQEDAIPNVVVDMVRVRMSDRRLFIYTHGRGIFTARITPYGKSIPDHNTVGIENPTKHFAKAYPNPANDFMHVQWDMAGGATQEIQLIDALGRTIKTLQVTNNGTISTSDLSNGIYYLKGKNIKTLKVLVQH